MFGGIVKTRIRDSSMRQLRLVIWPTQSHPHPGYYVSAGNVKTKAGYTATLVARRWAGAVLEKVKRASAQEPYAQNTKTPKK